MQVILPSITQHKTQDTKIYPSTDYVLYFDGCSKGNPGPAGIGAVIYNKGKEYWSSFKYIGNNKTNNQAEYCALIFGLEKAITLNVKQLTVCGDSLLVINQVNKIYKVTHPNLFELYEQVKFLKTKFTYIDFNHVYRKDNKRADELSNIALKFVNDIYSETITIDNFSCIDRCFEKTEDWNEEVVIEETEDWNEEIVIEKMLSNKKNK